MLDLRRLQYETAEDGVAGKSDRAIRFESVCLQLRAFLRVEDGCHWDAEVGHRAPEICVQGESGSQPTVDAESSEQARPASPASEARWSIVDHIKSPAYDIQERNVAITARHRKIAKTPLQEKVRLSRTSPASPMSHGSIDGLYG